MKSKRSRLMLAIIAMSCISLYGCGTAEDNAAVDNISKLESDQSEQLVKNDSEIETEVDSVDELSETDVEAQEDDVEVESADN